MSYILYAWAEEARTVTIVTVVERTTLGRLSAPQHSSSIFDNVDTEQLHAAQKLLGLNICVSSGLQAC